jgi:hypothetical protein
VFTGFTGFSPVGMPANAHSQAIEEQEPLKFCLGFHGWYLDKPEPLTPLCFTGVLDLPNGYLPELP